MTDQQVCTALIVYRPPSMFTSLDLATLSHGSHTDRRRVLEATCIRALGVPTCVARAGETRYSSSRLW